MMQLHNLNTGEKYFYNQLWKHFIERFTVGEAWYQSNTNYFVEIHKFLKECVD